MVLTGLLFFKETNNFLHPVVALVFRADRLEWEAAYDCAVGTFIGYGCANVALRVQSNGKAVGRIVSRINTIGRFHRVLFVVDLGTEIPLPVKHGVGGCHSLHLS